MTIVHDSDLEMKLLKYTVACGITPFMAPELLVPSRFGLDKSVPTTGADVYAMAMVIYQVRVVRCPTNTHIDSRIVGPHRIIAVR